MMPPPRRAQQRPTNLNKVLTALEGLQVAERNLSSLDDARLSDDARAAVGELTKQLAELKARMADVIEAVSNGTLTKRAPRKTATALEQAGPQSTRQAAGTPLFLPPDDRS